MKIFVKYFHEFHKYMYEICYYIESINSEGINDSIIAILVEMLSDSYKNPYLIDQSFFDIDPQYKSAIVIEYGSRANFQSAWCTNVLNILTKCNIMIKSIEYTNRIISTDFIEYIGKIDEMVQEFYTMGRPISVESNKVNTIIDTVIDIDEYNDIFDQYELKLYKSLYKKLNRDPTVIELSDLAQSNSEHSRHWVFNGKLILNGEELSETLFSMVKSTLKEESNSLLAFCDNASAIKGFTIAMLVRMDDTNNLILQYRHLHPTLTAETHNFPTAVAPFEGAATGVGGRIRDTHAIGKGGFVVAGLAGYCVGNLHLSDIDYDWERTDNIYLFNDAKTILIEASNGASDYGNKIGEPIIGGFTRSFGMIINNKQIEWVKPIMFTAGIGQIDNNALYKDIPDDGDIIIRLGGPAYPIGINGGSLSSMTQSNSELDSESNSKSNFESDLHQGVQRGDPEMENKLNRVIRECIEMSENNPIISIHDQGAGGLANVVKEIIAPSGGEVYLKNITLGDKTMSPNDIWIAEFQESSVILVKPESIDIIKKICEKENCICDIIGVVNNSGRITVQNSIDEEKYVDLPLNDILENIPQKTYYLEPDEEKYKTSKLSYQHLMLANNDQFCKITEKILHLVSVGSKRFLTNKVDRSVTGLIAQQQCVGPLHTPLSDYSLVAHTFIDKTGTASSIGERPSIGLINPAKMARMCVGEMLTNLMGVSVTSINDIKCSGNWMWNINGSGEKYTIYEAVKSLTDIMIQLGISIDGGKDSMSMSANINGREIESPRQLVLTSYCTCPNINMKITPDFKYIDSHILYVDLSNHNCGLAGTAFAQIINQLGIDEELPDIHNADMLLTVFNCIQDMINRKLISSIHDKSDGGLITTILEMCFAGNIGCEILSFDSDHNEFEYFFNEELGLILEIPSSIIDTVYEIFNSKHITTYDIGKTTDNNKIFIKHNNQILINTTITSMRYHWELTSYNLEKMQSNETVTNSEFKYLTMQSNWNNIISYQINRNVLDFLKKYNDEHFPIDQHTISVLVLREEGSNGDKEMHAVLHDVGFTVIDMNMNELIANVTNSKKNTNIFNNVMGIVFVGGFSYSDVLGSANGWYHTIKQNELLNYAFSKFYNRKDTFSLGICNGCQLMSRLGWIPNCKLEKNKSNRFESRFPSVKVYKSNSIFLTEMEGSIFGVWSAHGEGQFVFEPDIDTDITTISIPLRYIDPSKKATTRYPFNPNGSQYGAAAVSSTNGRHFAMMPHPERSFLSWQVPWQPENLKQLKYTMWAKMFRNAYEWCVMKQ